MSTAHKDWPPYGRSNERIGLIDKIDKNEASKEIFDMTNSH